MSKAVERSGDGPLLTFSRNLEAVIRNLEAVIKNLPEDFARGMTLPQDGRGIPVETEGGLEVFGLRLDATEEVIATIRRLYAEQLIEGLVKRDLMGGRDYVHSSERPFKEFGTVRALEFASGTCEDPLGYHGEGWTPVTSHILGAQILHRFSVDGQTRGVSVFRWAVVEMPETRCEFREAVPMSMGDSTDVTFVSGKSGTVEIHDSGLLGIAKGAGKVKWVQRLTIPEFEEKLAGVVS